MGNLLALSGIGESASALVALVALTAGAVAAVLRLKGETREAIEEAADRRVDEARAQVEQMATVGREWRENFQGLEQLRTQENQRHEAAAKDLQEKLTQATADLAVARAKTDLSGLEERLNQRFDAFLNAQQKQTEVLTALASTVADLAGQVHRDQP